ncbi:MAG: acyl-CoA dehydrogenase family protein [Thermodesulfobacteriota bacterium]|nr:acyl-CoA dehydrogenase family protein [Thermodesulfobacteriota bacterium]
MNFDLTDEQKMLKETVRKFSEKEIAPLVEEMDQEEKFIEDLWEKAKPLGFLGMGIPPEYDGMHTDYLSFGLMGEELGKVDAGVATVFGSHSLLCANNIARNGTEEQKKKYLSILAKGEKRGCMGLTEPGAGSDATSLKTSARKVGNEYILNGTKTFISNAPIADIALIYATVDPSIGTNGLCAFIVEKDFPGYQVGRKLSKMGLRSSPTGEIIMEDCHVPEENLLGGVEGKGLGQMFSGLDVERFMWSCLAIGIAQAAFDVSLRYSKEREQFGRPIFNFEMIQDKLVSMLVEIEAARLLAYKGLTLWDQGKLREARMLAAQSKLYACEMSAKVTGEAVHIHGGYGYMKEFPVERYMRDAKVFPIGAGTSEVQKLIIAHSLR